MADQRTDADSMGPGAELRSAREARGLSVHQVAVELHVSDSFINALERGDYGVLGEPVFVRGHLRNYARAVGLPEGQVLAAYEAAQNKPTAPRLVTQHAKQGGMHPQAREWTLRAATAAVVVVLLVLAISWWQRRPEETVGPPASVTTQPLTPPVPAATGPAPVTTLTELADNNSTQTQAPAQKPAQPAAPAQKLASSTPLAAAPRPAPVRAAPRTETAEMPAQPATHTQQAVVGPGEAKNLTHVKFTLGAASWIEVYDNNGKRLYYDLAPAGDTLDLSSAGPLQVFLGNAPGVSIELNGAPFDLKPYARADNTARFKLGMTGG